MHANVLFVVLLAGCTAATAPAPVPLEGPASDPAPLVSGELRSNFGVQPVSSGGDVSFEALGAVVESDAALESGSGGTPMRYQLAWEGQPLEGSAVGRVGRSADQLTFVLEGVVPRVGEDRYRGVSVGVPAAGFQAGAVLAGTLSYHETPVDSEWLDVLLQAPVQVEVLVGDGSIGSVAGIRVVDAELVPTWDVGAAIAGEFYAGAFDLELDATGALDCGALSADALDFVSSPPAALGVEGTVYVNRAHQGFDAMAPFQITGRAIDALTRFDGTRTLTRVPGAGGWMVVEFRNDDAFGMDPVPGPDGLFEIDRTLQVDGSAFVGGFPFRLVRTYADAPDADVASASCTATFAGMLVPQ